MKLGVPCDVDKAYIYLVMAKLKHNSLTYVLLNVFLNDADCCFNVRLDNNGSIGHQRSVSICRPGIFFSTHNMDG